ncbi:MAG TPA: hypothetical protein VMR52_06690 [Dehalococcoidia bacterium]|nr:hypothetical protein [Dehalococcoidia bacterium]
MVTQRKLVPIADPDPLGLGSWGGALNERMRRLEIQERVTAWFDIGLSLLAVLLVGLLVAEFTMAFGDPWDGYILAAQTGIWITFVVAFAIELYLAPSVVGYLRSHWLAVLSLAIPALRVFRVLNALRVLRGLRIVRSFQLVRTSSALTRAIRVIDDFFQFSRVGYLIMLILLLTPTGGVLAYYLERGQPDATITTVPEGIWWAIANITTLDSSFAVATWEGRIVSLALRIFGLAVVGYLTAAIAVFLIGKRESPEAPARQDELRALRQEIARLRETVESRD